MQGILSPTPQPDARPWTLPLVPRPFVLWDGVLTSWGRAEEATRSYRSLGALGSRAWDQIQVESGRPGHQDAHLTSPPYTDHLSVSAPHPVTSSHS
jgi:hypothetical protein